VLLRLEDRLRLFLRIYFRVYLGGVVGDGGLVKGLGVVGDGGLVDVVFKDLF